MAANDTQLLMPERAVYEPIADEGTERFNRAELHHWRATLRLRLAELASMPDLPLVIEGQSPQTLQSDALIAFHAAARLDPHNPDLWVETMHLAYAQEAEDLAQESAEQVLELSERPRLDPLVGRVDPEDELLSRTILREGTNPD